MSASKVIIRTPPKDAEHYIFRKTNRLSPALDVLVIKDALLSVDIRRPGMTEFYVHDKKGKLIPQVSRGQSPFLTPNPIHVSETIGLIDDWFSEMNICHFLLDTIPRL